MPGGPLNEAFLGYMQWVTAIEDSLIDHVAAELNNYTEIAAEVVREGHVSPTVGFLRTAAAGSHIHLPPRQALIVIVEHIRWS
jgi:hypothetical protein